MESQAGITLEAIHKAGRQEFLNYGFRTASLRNIVKAAGVTTGAFYGYYKSKEELFGALVDEQYSTMIEHYVEAHREFEQLSPAGQSLSMGEISENFMLWACDYVYDNIEAFRLILCCSEGTKYNNMIHEMAELEIEATHKFVEVLRSLGREVPEFDPRLEHILVSGMLTGFFEMFIHNMPPEKSHEYIRELSIFYTAGWRELMGF